MEAKALKAQKKLLAQAENAHEPIELVDYDIGESDYPSEFTKSTKKEEDMTHIHPHTPQKQTKTNNDYQYNDVQTEPSTEEEVNPWKDQVVTDFATGKTTWYGNDGQKETYNEKGIRPWRDQVVTNFASGKSTWYGNDGQKGEWRPPKPKNNRNLLNRIGPGDIAQADNSSMELAIQNRPPKQPSMPRPDTMPGRDTLRLSLNRPTPKPKSKQSEQNNKDGKGNRIVNGFMAKPRPWAVTFDMPGPVSPGYCAGSLVNHRYVM